MNNIVIMFYSCQQNLHDFFNLAQTMTVFRLFSGEKKKKTTEKSLVLLLTLSLILISGIIFRAETTD